MPSLRIYAVVTRFPPDYLLAAMDICIGALYVLQGPRRTTSAALAVARDVMPLDTWGVYFIVVGALLICAVHTRRRAPTLAYQLVGPALFVMWVIMFLISSVRDNRASLVGVPIYLYLAYRHSLGPITRAAR